MGFFDRLFKKSTPQKETKPIKETQQTQSIKTEQELLEKYIGLAFEKQLSFSSLIEGKEWDADLTQGSITFGEQMEFPIQILGSFSYSVNTWLWAWANQQSNLPENLLPEAFDLRRYGLKHKIDQFRKAEYPFKQDDLKRVGLIATGMFDDDGYYLADYGGGVMLMTVKSPIIKKNREDQPHKIFSTFSKIISNFELNHKTALSSYLAAKGYQVVVTKDEIRGTKGKENFVAKLDSSDRVIHFGS